MRKKKNIQRINTQKYEEKNDNSNKKWINKV